jgi:ATP-dependent Clp protease adaptor protein ClpS
MPRQKTKPAEKNKELSGYSSNLVLHNDDVNTFEFVIESLVEVCGHDFEQAEQCALIAHFKGRCAVKSGNYTDLKGMSDELTLRKLSVSLE